MASIKYGAIAEGSHTGTSRSIQKSDNATLDVEIFGDYNSLENVVLQSSAGDSAGLLVNNAGGDLLAGYRVKTLSCARGEGEVGVLRASLVYANSVTDPYHITYTIDMVEVQKSLISHPLFRQHNKCLEYITKWNETNATVRVKFGATPEEDQYYYIDSASASAALVAISDEYALKYCRAVTAGIETYNVYLPVISKVSLYLKEPPGASQDEHTHELSGTLRYSTNIGKWDSDFGFTLQGYEVSEKQGWFKSRDRYVQNGDGVWQREEEWTFTNDKTHAWIYEEAV